jgi:hypothetical protein
MRPSTNPGSHLLPLVSFFLVTGALLFAASCGSSETSTNVFGPSTGKCQVSLANNPGTFGHEGGTGRVTVSTERECTWTATSEADWVAITSPREGQGQATLEYSVATNPNASTRRAGITISGSRVEVAQQPAPCVYSLDRPGDQVAAGGGALFVQVGVISGCQWTATSNVPWIAVGAGASGSGAGAVRLDVSQNNGPARNGTVTIAGQTFTVTQQAAGADTGCVVSAVPAAHAVESSGGQVMTVVTAPATCSWSAISSAAWITVVSGQNGVGNGTVVMSVAANTGPPRSGTVTIGGQIVAINQAGPTAGCSYAVAPTSHSVAAGGGQVSSSVTTAAACSWQAQSMVGWITIAAGASGTGSGTVVMNIAPNDGAARNGIVTIAGQTVTVSQAAAGPSCSYAIDPVSQSFGPEGGDGQVTVQTTQGCGWTAGSGAGWISIVSGASGTGTGQVRYQVAGNSSPDPREGVVNVAGQIHAVLQAGRNDIELEGVVQSLSGSCPNLTFVVQGYTVVTNSATRFTDGACPSLRNGREVEVDGYLLPDGRVLATEVDQD